MSKRAGGMVFGLVALVVVVLAVAGGVFLGGGGASGPVLLTHSDEQTLANDLKQASQHQNICYGWQLTLVDHYSGHSGTTVGSNQGPGRPLDTGRCARWVTMTGHVTWTSSASNSPDSGYYQLHASPDLVAKLPSRSRMNRIGFSTKTMINNPSVAVENLMEGLPLLMAEAGAAPALPVKADKPSSKQVVPPASVNSDRWRNHKGEIIFGVLALVAALVCVVLGVVSWRRRKHAGTQEPPDDDTPTPPTGTPWPPGPPSGETSGPQYPPRGHREI